MSLSAPIALIFGAGKNVGAGVARAFTAKGYRIATVSRTASTDSDNDKQMHIRGDMADPESISGIFDTVRKYWGHPSVVVINGSANTFWNKEDPLKVPFKDAVHDMNVNVMSPLVAAQEAVTSFEALPADAARTYIYTGNITNLQIIPPLMVQGMGKSAAAHMIESAIKAYQSRGYKFYYADERKPDGSAAYKIDGDEHGKVYVELSEKEQGPWLVSFVKGTGYVDFSKTQLEAAPPLSAPVVQKI